MTQAGDLWTKCSGSLRDQVSESTWQLWLSGIEPVAFTDGIFTLAVPNGLIRERVESRYLPMIEDTLANEVGSPVRGRLEVLDAVAVGTSVAPIGSGRGAPAADVPAPMLGPDDLLGFPGEPDPLPAPPVVPDLRAGTGRDASVSPARCQVHLRNLRRCFVEQVGACRRAGGGGNARSFL